MASSRAAVAACSVMFASVTNGMVGNGALLDWHPHRVEVDGMAGEAIPDIVRADEAEVRKHEEDQDKHQQLVEEARNQATDLHSTDLDTVKRNAEEQVDRIVRAMPKADRSI
jgi:hypothetical protein